jgi:predicted RNase H-like HicB family nuclease
MPTYIALMRKNNAGNVGVDFPDFPGCVTAAVTLQDARRGGGGIDPAHDRHD